MREVLEGLLIASVVMLTMAVLAVLWLRQRLRRQLRIAPRVRSAAPTLWLVSPSAPARLHRRLRNVGASARLASTLDPGLAPMAEDLVAEALVIEPRVLAVAGARRAGSSVRRDLSGRISELEAVARRLAVLSTDAGSPAEERATRLRDRLVALEAAREELAEIDLGAGLLRHS